MKKLFLYSLAFLLICACSNSISEVNENYEKIVSQDSTYDNFKVIEANGHSVLLGTLSSESTPKERPAMKVYFTYDFSIGKHEVTCEEYNYIAQNKIPCSGNLLPASNVTYFDAVLYANAFSKSFNLDTAYTYTKAVFDGEGNCVDLEDLVFYPDKDAFRLPTEAEWVITAQTAWDPKNSWSSDNSGLKAHDVCTITTDSNAICDMAGNVMEWTNDWLVHFRDTTVTNFVGAPSAGGQNERVVKGGSYRNGSKKINLYSRGDVYTVTSATKAEYVGFRLAKGIIPNPTWISSNGITTNSRIFPIANSSTIKTLTGTFRAKLAFRNDMSGNLAFIDYMSGTSAVNEIQDTMEVFHPDISPDGKKVAFSTSFEGSNQKSSLYVRDLNISGTNLVKLDVESAAIPRWVVTAEGDTAIIYVNNAGSNKDDVTFKQNSTWMVTFSQGAFGVPQKLFDGSYHGGVSTDTKLAVTGSTKLRARMFDGETIKDSLWLDAEQACNVSLNRDNSKRTAFLDFGSNAGKTFTRTDYNIHEMLLVADSTGKLIQGIPSPEGFSFDHSEWVVGNGESGQNDLIIATLSAYDAHPQIVLVNIKDSSVTELVKGDELWHPCFWASTNTENAENGKVNVDSAGKYYSADAGLLQTYKMKLFWENLDSIEYIALGSSRMSSGFRSSLFTSGKAINMATVPNDMDVSYYLWNNYILNHAHKLKVLVIGIDFDLWYSGHMEMVRKNNGSAPGYVYDANHNFWVDGIPEGFIEQVDQLSFPDMTEYEGARYHGGWVALDCQNWGKKEDGLVFMDSSWSDNSQLIQNSIEQLRSIIETAQNKGIKVLGVIFPQSPDFQETGAFGRYGFKRSKIPQMMQELDYMVKQFPNFKYIDENKMGKHDYTDSEAYDFDHLCYMGAEKITARIIEALQEF